jgi:hypothetical protein
LSDQFPIIDFTDEPGSCGFLEDRPSNRESATDTAVGCIDETLCHFVRSGVQTEQHHSTAIWIAPQYQFIEPLPHGPRLRLEFPPLRINADVVQPLDGAWEYICHLPGDFRWNQLYQQLVTTVARRIIQ